MFPYGQSYRPQMPPGMPGFGFPGSAPPGIGGMGLPPGMVPPPGFGPPPGVGAPPGVPIAQSNMPTRPGMPGFVPPANLPNINFNAPIIRLGTSGTRSSAVTGGSGGSGGQGGSGGKMDGGRGGGSISFVRDSGTDLVPPTAEEQLKTVFIMGIPKEFNDEWMERVLMAVAKLRRWIRATDEDGRPCKFGFAEYEDVISLECAIEVLKDLEIPPIDEGKAAVKLIVTSDEKSEDYIEKYYDNNPHNIPDTETKNTQIEAARTAVQTVLKEYADPTKREAKGAEPTPTPAAGADGVTEPKKDGADTTTTAAPQPEIVTIPLSADDELSDIPADMREMVAKEIAAFRERSNRRDMERMKREEEVERMERERNHAPRMSRLASPPLSAPTGPSGGSNSIPIGPSRHREVPTAPSRMVKGVSFVNGTTNNNNSSTLPSNTSTSSYWTREEEDSSASDSELESRRRKKKSHDLESAFLDHERRWLNRERSRTSALERETQRDREDEARAKLEVESMATRLANWDDTVEAARKLEDYYVDRSLWIRNRTLFRQREIEMDERDRAMEIRQQEQEKKHAAESMADSFLARQAEELETRTHPSSSSNTTTAPHNTTNNPAQPKFKLALSAAIKKTVGADAPNKHGGRRTTTTDVENLLEDEEEDESKTKRVLVPIQYDDDANGSGGGIGAVDEETREQLVRQLAQEIPSDKKGLFEWKVQWEFLDEQMVGEKLKPFVEKKIVEYLGVQETDLINFVLDHIRKRGTAEDLVKELEMALDEDAEVMVKKVWRMVIFWSESERRGLV